MSTIDSKSSISTDMASRTLATSSLDPVESHAGSKTSGNILVVDDEERVRRLIAAVLSRHGYTVTTAANGRIALQALRDSTFELVITDLQMPEMNGLALLEQCKELYPGTDVIMLTAYGTIQSAVHAMKFGALDYATKPFHLDELERKVDGCFEQRRLREKAAQDSPIQPFIELTRILDSDVPFDEIQTQVLDLVQRTLDADGAELVLFTQGMNHSIVSKKTGVSIDHDRYPILSLDHMQKLVQTGSPWLLCDEGAAPPPERRGQSGLRLSVPLYNSDRVLGALNLIRAAARPRFDQADGEALHVFGFQVGIAMLHSDMGRRLTDAFRDLERATLANIESLSATLGIFDENTYHHSERVARYAYQLGQQLGLSDRELETLRIGGLLHDIGKVGSSGEVRKDGNLSDTEWENIRMHPVRGARILSGSEAFVDALPLVLHHHERFDGEGYPDRLAGESIPLGARILAVVDVYDSMSTDRPYRPAMPQQEVIEYIKSVKDIALEGRLVDIWLTILSG